MFFFMRNEVGACGAPYHKAIFEHSAVLRHDPRQYEDRFDADE